MRELPEHPSSEHLRKQAKRLARNQSLQLADAQRSVAQEYGYPSWAQLLRYVANVRGEKQGTPPLFAAVRARDEVAVRRLLTEGVNPRVGDGRETPLHAAARHGPLSLVETLLEGGALEWQTDAAGRTPLDVARRGRARERTAIIALLDRSLIEDASFRAAVATIHKGDVGALVQLLEAEPRLLHERIVEPEVYRRAARHQYFRDPKLFWFVANNPTRVARMPANITNVAQVMIDHGVEQSDLDYTLGLTMTSSVAREQGHQLALMRVLLAAGARATREAISSTAAHGELEALRALVAGGQPVDAPIGAALGANEALHDLVITASPEDIQVAFGLAVINRNVEGARIALDAGADPNAFLPVHVHSTALHQAAINDQQALLELLLAHGARADQRDKLWDGTPLDWAIHENRPAARAILASRQK